jgi:drug/metabolite transporter (DMT)-like permease
LAAGPMSVVAPTTAVCSAVVPLVVGLATGERPSAMALTGALLALPAVVLVARESGSHGRATPRVVALSVAAGVGFGGFFVALAGASADAGMWPLAAARVASLTIVIGLCFVTRRGLRVAEGALPAIALTGVLDVTANGLYLLAAGQGLLSVVAVLGSLYPASTVLLAMAMLHERLARAQVIGLVLAGVAVALIAVGN